MCLEPKKKVIRITGPEFESMVLDLDGTIVRGSNAGYYAQKYGLKTERFISQFKARQKLKEMEMTIVVYAITNEVLFCTLDNEKDFILKNFGEGTDRNIEEYRRVEFPGGCIAETQATEIPNLYKIQISLAK